MNQTPETGGARAATRPSAPPVSALPAVRKGVSVGGSGSTLGLLGAANNGAATVPITPGKQVASVTLPAASNLHLFDLAID